MIIIKQPILTGNYTASADLIFPDRTQTLWFESSSPLVDASDGFLVAILPRAMIEGSDIVVEGHLSSHLYYNLTQYYMELLRTLIPGAKKITITAKSLTTKDWGGKGVFTGFSAGIDSFFTILNHMEDVSPEYRVTHLLFNNVGSHGQTGRDQAVFDDRYQRLKANSMGLPLIQVNSNLDQILKMDFQLTHTIRNVATALLFQGICGKFLYSSTVHYRDSIIELTHDMGYADAVGVALLSTETIECISSGGQHTRFEKTDLISQKPVTYLGLDVCVAPQAGKINCSQCWKCLRTQLTLDVLGSLEDYRNVFNIAAYRRLRWLFIANVLRNPDSLIKEISDEIRKRKFAVPFTSKVASFIPQKILTFALTAAPAPKKAILAIYHYYVGAVKRRLLRLVYRQSTN